MGARLPVRTIVVVVGGVLAAWTAAGSLGWMAPSLQKVLTWAALALALWAAWPACRDAKARWIVVAAGAAALLMTAWPLAVVNVLGVALVLAAIADALPEPEGRAAGTAAMAAGALAVFNLACQSTATVWAAADSVGHLLGSLAGWATGRPLDIGASFAGLDFLVLMAALWVGWFVAARAATLTGAVRAAAAIVLVHAAYLVALAFSCDLTAALPTDAAPTATDISRMGFWSWTGAARAWVPWGLPAVAAAGHAAVVVGLFRSVRWQTATAAIDPLTNPKRERGTETGQLPRLRVGLVWGPPLLAVVAAAALAWPSGRSDLKGLRVLAYETGGVEWGFPTGPAATQPSFGLLAPLVESLGGRFTRSDSLDGNRLDEADVLLLLPPGPKGLSSWRAPPDLGPDEPRRPLLFSQENQDKILDFVRRGGTLLVAASPERHPGALENVFNDLLGPTGIHIEDQAVRPLTPRWEDNIRAAVPAGRGGLAAGGGVGLDRGASLRIAWPAGPLVIGRWGWGEPAGGPPRGGAYALGQRLGDLVLAAQRRLGQGRVVVLGDAMCLSSRSLPSSYAFVGRLLGSPAAKTDGPMALWRQWLALAALTALVGLAWRADTPHQEQSGRLAVTAGVLAVALAGCTVAGDNIAAQMRPEGRPQSPRPVVYVDASHLAAAAIDPDRDDGLGQWFDILGHDGYLPLWAPDLSPARLRRAAMLVSIAPARPLGSDELSSVQGFVEGGGTLLAMVGAEEAGPSLPLLAQFDLSVAPVSDSPEPEHEPLGGGNTYVTQSYADAAGEGAEAQFYAPWAATATVQAAEPLFWSGTPQTPPSIVYQRVRSGAVVLVADTYFATNKNFDAEEPAARHNAHFWGWLLAELTGRKPPPAPKPELPGPAPPKEPVEPPERGILDAGKATEVKP
ncbi:MAG: DUF4350 domain-containing protein [Thermoguttaceae bacterium]